MGAREALTAITSLYVIALVILGSAIYGNYDVLNTKLSSCLRSPRQRHAETERQRELDKMRRLMLTEN